MFDKNKVLTAVTADQAKVGDLGWFADDLEDLRKAVECIKPSEIGDIRSESLSYRFVKDSIEFLFFYPAPYELAQAKWVEENDLKVGDRVRLIRDWLNGENGYPFVKLSHMSVGDIFTVREIKSYTILVVEDDCAFLPYFAIEKVEGEYRPYSKEALAGLVGETLVRNGNYPEESIRRVLVVGYSDGKIIVPSSVGNLHYDAQGVLDCFRHVTGNPAGVKY